jgi:hypothetical protein
MHGRERRFNVFQYLPPPGPNVPLADEMPLGLYSHLSGNEMEPARTGERGVGKVPKGVVMVSGL